jgi:hypothetical protein
MRASVLVVGRALFSLLVVQAAGQAHGQAPSITSPGSTTFTDGSAGTFTVTTTGSPTPSISIAPVAPTAGLPSGLSFADNGDGTATLSGTPAVGTAGAYTYSLTAANGLLPDATQTFTVTVHRTVVGTWTMTKKLSEEGVSWVSKVEIHADGTLTDSSFDVANPGPATGTWSVSLLTIVLFYQASQYVFDGILDSGYTSMYGSISQGSIGYFFANRDAPPCYTLTTGVDPAGGGSVSADLGPGCNATQYTSGTVVRLTAAPANGYAFSSWSGAASGSANPVAVTMDADKSVTASFALRTSVTIAAATGNGNITLSTTSPGCGLFAVQAYRESDLPVADPSHDYPYGLVAFSLNCAAADVTITWPGDLTGTSYRKYGPTTPGSPPTAAWYDFDATLAGNQATLHLVDGQRGDDTGVDGVIVDQGGPSAPFVQVPALGTWGVMILTMLLGVAAIHRLWRAGA